MEKADVMVAIDNGLSPSSRLSPVPFKCFVRADKCFARACSKMRAEDPVGDNAVSEIEFIIVMKGYPVFLIAHSIFPFKTHQALGL